MYLYLILFVIFAIIYYYYDTILLNIYVFLIVNRGLISPNCFWWKVSNTFVTDSSGILLYNKIKRQSGDMVPINIFGNPMYLVTSIQSIKEMLDNSPDPFCVGRLKYNFFKPFMRYNVGVSNGCPWKRRRILNEHVLVTNDLHKYSDHHNTVISRLLQKQQPKNFDEFINIAQRIISRVVFNKEMIPKQIFEIFAIANSLQAVLDPKFELPAKKNKFYREFIWKELQDPQSLSLVSLCRNSVLEKEEMIDQVPHWIFPVGGIIHTVVPRTLVMVCNHPRVLAKLLRKMKEIDINNSEEIASFTYLRYCIMETLRLNNLVTSTFRTLCDDFTFSDGRYFAKGSQFLILNNPVLRETECFNLPNQYIPERWTKDMEDTYCAISFNQGPQKCPGKDISMFLIASFIVHYLKNTSNLKCMKINTKNIPQMISPCSIRFTSFQ